MNNTDGGIHRIENSMTGDTKAPDHKIVCTFVVSPPNFQFQDVMLKMTFLYQSMRNQMVIFVIETKIGQCECQRSAMIFGGNKRIGWN